MLLNLPEPPLIVLVHSPLIGPAAWGRVPDELRDRGHDVLVLEIAAEVDEPMTAFVGRAALAIGAAVGATTTQLVLVGQHEAGPLLPHLGAAQHASGRDIARYVLVNSLLPQPYGARGVSSMLDLIEAGDSGRADQLRGMLLDGLSFPNCDAEALAPFIADEQMRAEVVAHTHPRDLAWYAAPLPTTGEWPDAPVTYIHSAHECEWEARQAELRGWTVQRCAGGTFAAINAPNEVGSAIVGVNA